MNTEVRLTVPGGLLTVQDLRDLVGWAGAAQATGFRMGDCQDLVLEGAAVALGPAPGRFRRADQGSLQAAPFGDHPTAAHPWLTDGVWNDLIASLPDPGPLDVQLVHEPARAHFLRHGHLRFTARRAPHQWLLTVRRPGSDQLWDSATSFDSGELGNLVSRARQAWSSGDPSFWSGTPAVWDPPSVDPAPVFEGFHREGSSGFSFGYRPSSGRISVTRLRDLAWLADQGTPAVRLLPDRTLVFEGIPVSRRVDWEDWLGRERIPLVHGSLDHAVVAAGWSPAARTARDEVMAFLSARDQVPPVKLLVADEALNRSDGVAARPFGLFIRTSSSWIYRTPDGRGAGEGDLAMALEGLGATRPSSSPPPSPEVVASLRRRCTGCLTVYDPAYGDPQGGVVPGIPFETLPSGWICPVCGGPRELWESC